MSGRFYDTREWRDYIQPAQLAREPLCAMCLAFGRTTAATEVDHVKRIEAGGDPRSSTNLQSLCHSCHSIKTGSDKTGGLIPGCDASGLPLDARHPWRTTDG